MGLGQHVEVVALGGDLEGHLLDPADGDPVAARGEEQEPLLQVERQREQYVPEVPV